MDRDHTWTNATTTAQTLGLGLILVALTLPVSSAAFVINKRMSDY